VSCHRPIWQKAAKISTCHNYFLYVIEQTTLVQSITLALALKFCNSKLIHFPPKPFSAIFPFHSFNIKLLATILITFLINHLIKDGISPHFCVLILLHVSKYISIALDSSVSVTPLLKLKPSYAKLLFTLLWWVFDFRWIFSTFNVDVQNAQLYTAYITF